MTCALKTALVAATFLAGFSAAEAQTRPSDSPRAFGHWEGVANSQLGSVPLEIDIGADSAGKPIAALSLPGQGIEGLPLRDVKIEAGNVAFEMPISGEGSFLAALSEDGQALAGTLDKGFGVADFSLQRAGEAHFPTEPANKPVDPRFAGEWTGALDPGGRNIPIAVSLTNRGSAAIARLTIEGGVAFPLAVHESGDTLKLDIVSASESMDMTFDSKGDGLTGSYVSSSGGRSQLTLKRSNS